MSAKLILDTNAMHEDFFTNAVLLGVACALPSYSFCWLLNERMDLELKRMPDSDVCMNTSKNVPYYFPFFYYKAPMDSNEFSVYQLNVQKQTLLPELKGLDYLCMIQGPNAETDGIVYLEALRSIKEIQLAQLLDPSRLKNIDYLLI